MSVDNFAGIAAESRFNKYLTRWAERASRAVVLFLDEIDALLDDTTQQHEGREVAVLRS